ncbi:MAG: hypothetical protein FWD01_05395, partial [Defluviitaleaceae bacterium]|nr:hypothetical protein [Defluviitaleaceae bacterium]
MSKKIINDIEIFVSDIDNYLQINDIGGSDLIKIWEKIKTDYADYDKWICYHNYSDIPFDLLDEIGAVILDDCIETHLTADNFAYSEVDGVVRITEENFDEFAARHMKCNPESGAQPARIKRDFSKWAVFAFLSDNQIADYIIIYIGNP